MKNKSLKSNRRKPNRKKLKQKVNEGQQLRAEEQREQARKAARDLGLVTREEFETLSREEYAKNAAIGRLLEDTGVAIEKYKNDYDVQTQVDDVLKYMDDNGLKNPDKAIKLMFEDKIDQVKEQKLKSIRPQGMTTNESSQAGGKQPPVPGVAKSEDELTKQLHEFLQG